MISETETLLCKENIFVFCKLFGYDYINDCDKDIELFGITLYRPVLLLICGLAIILELSALWNVLTKFNKHMDGKIEYTLLHCFACLWYTMLMIDRYIVYYISSFF